MQHIIDLVPYVRCYSENGSMPRILVLSLFWDSIRSPKVMSDIFPQNIAAIARDTKKSFFDLRQNRKNRKLHAIFDLILLELC